VDTLSTQPGAVQQRFPTNLQLEYAANDNSDANNDAEDGSERHGRRRQFSQTRTIDQ